MLEALKNYSSVVKMLLGFLRQCREAAVDSSQTMSREVYEHMGRDIFISIVRLVLFFRHENSYQEFWACRGTDAQVEVLLDLLQDTQMLKTLSVKFLKGCQFEAAAMGRRGRGGKAESIRMVYGIDGGELSEI
ncbi:hypothetical protein DFH07DRAFT_775077 [Mycena maculata]|uniref:Uncharacterized protein n=1 Tax=Mycena maculata TaxID=230809 RepID=A0AAD7N8Z8_9AGAR|nr:hypothetical protein DFH07DRAFT_775077 [Mycena maculata]